MAAVGCRTISIRQSTVCRDSGLKAVAEFAKAEGGGHNLCAGIRLIVLGERVFGRGLDLQYPREGEHEAPNGLKH